MNLKIILLVVIFLSSISLYGCGRKDLPISRVGSPQPLLELEHEGAEIARFLGVNLEGL